MLYEGRILITEEEFLRDCEAAFNLYCEHRGDRTGHMASALWWASS